MSQEPQRLKDAAATSPELGEALKALRDPTRDVARIARVEQQLGRLLDAPPGAAAVGAAGAAHTLRWLIVGCMGAGVLWLGGAALFSNPPAAEPRTPEPVAQPAPSTAPESAEPVQPEPVQAEPARAAPAPESADAEPNLGLRAPATKRSQRATRVHAVPRAEAAAQRNAAHAPSNAGGSSLTSAAGSSPQHHVEPAAAPPVAARPASAPPQDAGAEVRPPSEVELLFEARAMRGSQPREALRLLDQHAQRFAEGMLAPERELMAIEILRSLGQASDAEARLARFRARYPKSLHLRRLEQAAPR